MKKRTAMKCTYSAAAITTLMSATLSVSMDLVQTKWRETKPDKCIQETYSAYYFVHPNAPSSHKNPSEIYKFTFPKVPLFHPYNIETELRETHNTPLSFKVPLFTYHPSEQVDALPTEVDPYIPQDMPRNKIDWMVAIQNMPWTQGAPILYRPHYYLEPNATYLGIYNNAQTITAHCISYLGNPVVFSKEQMTATTHPADGVTVLSGAAGDSIVLNGIDNQQSSLFFTVFKHNDRLAVTLHGLLGDVDYDRFMGELNARQWNTLGEILDGPLSNLNGDYTFRFLRDIIDW